MNTDQIDPRYPRVSQGRRMLGLAIDWALCSAIAYGFLPERDGLPDSLTTLAIFTLQYFIFTIAGGATPGHRIVGLKIVRFSDEGAPTPKAALIRIALLVIVVTAITFDQNGRGINERLSNTVLVATRKLKD